MVVVSPKSGIPQIFFTSHLAGSRDGTKVEIRHWNLIVLKRGVCSRFFELPIANVSHLSLENEFNAYGEKLDLKRESNFCVLDFKSHVLYTDRTRSPSSDELR